MSAELQTVRVHILDKDYQVACPAEQRDALVESARYLDQQMRAIRQSGKVIGLERIAVMAALNITHELIQRGEQSDVTRIAHGWMLLLEFFQPLTEVLPHFLRVLEDLLLFIYFNRRQRGRASQRVPVVG